MNEFAERLIAQAKENPYFHLEGYMERYWLKPFDEKGMNLRVHHILTSDNDRHMHDHPWPSTSIILAGGYWEILPADQSQDPALDETHRIRVWRGPGTVTSRKATDRHLVELPDGKTSWSLFLMGEYEQKWGFYTPEGKVYWREYLNDWETETSTDKVAV